METETNRLACDSQSVPELSGPKCLACDNRPEPELFGLCGTCHWTASWMVDTGLIERSELEDKGLILPMELGHFDESANCNAVIQ